MYSWLDSYTILIIPGGNRCYFNSLSGFQALSSIPHFPDGCLQNKALLGNHANQLKQDIQSITVFGLFTHDGLSFDVMSCKILNVHVGLKHPDKICSITMHILRSIRPIPASNRGNDGRDALNVHSAARSDFL